MKKVYLVRHCSTAGQHRDSPLTTEGIRQAELLSRFLSDNNYPIDKIISSPYFHATESIKPYSDKINLKITTDGRLRERMLSNEPIDDWLEVLEHSFNNLDYNLPGGESSNDAVNRANKVIKGIANDSNVIIVTHDNLLSLIIKQYDDSFGFNQWKELKNPDVFLIDYANETPIIEHLWKH